MCKVSSFSLCFLRSCVFFCRRSPRPYMVPPGRYGLQGRMGRTRAAQDPVAPIRSMQYWNWNVASWMMLWVVLLSVMVHPIAAPVRDPVPNRDDDYHKLSGMTEWNGVPRRDFRRVWFAALIVALGAIFQDGWTLLQTARDEDAGGPSNPAVHPAPNDLFSWLTPVPARASVLIRQTLLTRRHGNALRRKRLTFPLSRARCLIQPVVDYFQHTRSCR